MSETKTTSGLPYLLCGLAVGAAIGVLFAPRKGEETREQIGDWLNVKREQSREVYSKIREGIPGKKEQVLAMWKAGKEKFQQAGNHKRHTVHA